jgi:hypothetical protein
MIPWKRFWCPLGSAISCGFEGSGFLDDPEDEFGGLRNANLREVTELVAEPCLVLCGEPGIGKTTTINSIHDELVGRLPSRQNLIWIEFRSIPNPDVFLRRTVQTTEWRAWEKSTNPFTLVIDGVDEGLIKIPEFIPFLTEELRGVDLKRLNVVLVCRTAEWPTQAGQQLINLWAEHAPRQSIFELCPLRQKDARLAAELRAIDADAFLEAVYNLHVVGLARIPITLFFLLDEFARTNSFPGTHRELYQIGCRRLCDEPDAARLEWIRRRYPKNPIPSAVEVHAVACRIAALSILSGRFAVYVGPLTRRTETDLHISEIAIGYESVDSASFQVTDSVVLETLQTGLFTSRGEDRFGFGHQTFAECLAAQYLERIPVIQVRQLLCQRDDGEQHVVPQLAQSAAWLAGGHQTFFRHLLDTEPEVLLRTDLTDVNSSFKAKLVDALIERVRCEEAFDDRGSARFYSALNHPGIAAQLATVIQDKNCHFVLRRMAIRIAGACKTAELTSLLIKVLQDPSEEYALKRFAASALADLIPLQRLSDLVPFAAKIDGDEDEEIRGAVLKTLIPRLWKVRDALPYLSAPQNPNHFGSYWMLLRCHVPSVIQDPDIEPLLQATSEWKHCFDSLSWFNKIADKTFVNALSRLNNTAVADRFVKAWLAKSREHVLPGQRKESELVKVLEDDTEIRRGALAAILNSPHTTPEDAKRIIRHPLVTLTDLGCFLTTLPEVPKNRREIWAAATARYVHSVGLTHDWDLFLETLEAVPELRCNFEWLRAWDLDEPLAKRERGDWLKQKELAKQFKENQELPDPEILIEDWLKKAAGGDANAWLAVSNLIFQEPGDHYYTVRPDITDSCGWKSAGELRRTEIAKLARQFLIKCSDIRGDESSRTRFSEAGYLAIGLLRQQIATDNELRKSVCEKWLLAILDFQNLVPEWHQEMLALAYGLDPNVCLHKLYNEWIEDPQRHAFMRLARDFKKCWDRKLSELMLLAFGTSTPQMADEIIQLLATVDIDSAELCVATALQRVGTSVTSKNEFLVSVLSSGICFLPTRVWPLVWPIVNNNDELAKIVFLRVGHHYGFDSGGVGMHLTPRQISDLYCLLVKLFPPAEDPPQEGGTVTPRLSVRHMRDGQLQVLTTMATDDSCRELLRLAAIFPNERLWLRWRYRECLTAKRRRLWTSLTPKEILKLIEQPSHRIVCDEDDLVEVVMESLDRLQENLTRTQNPQVGDLWNYQGRGTSRHSFCPKDEEDISGKIAGWLQTDLGRASGVILNREVQPRRGQKTDVLVDAIADANKGKQRVTIVIEVKGCWNPEVTTAIQTQLVDNYLQTNGWTRGIYLVGWFLCQRWDDPKRPQKSCLAASTYEEAIEEIAKLTKPFDGKSNRFLVRPYVLDARCS